MAALYTLWMGLVLPGVLGVLQTTAEAQVSLQPNFQQDKSERPQSPEADEKRLSRPAPSRTGRCPRPPPPRSPLPRRDGPRADLPREGAAGLRGGRRLEAGRGGAGAPTLRSREGPGRRGRGRFPQILGRWFTSGLASNSSWFREKKATLTMCTSVFTPTASGGLDLTTTFLRKDQCETRSLQLRPAGPPGCYSYTSPHSGNTQEVRVVETDYEDYALLYTSGTRDQDFHLATLYSRTQTPRAEVKEKFSAFAQAQGFTEDVIVFLPKTDKCMEGHQ